MNNAIELTEQSDPKGIQVQQNEREFTKETSRPAWKKHPATPLNLVLQWRWKPKLVMGSTGLYTGAMHKLYLDILNQVNLNKQHANFLTYMQPWKFKH